MTQSPHQRPLTCEELRHALQRISDAGSPAEVVGAAVFGALEPLLGDSGITVADLGPDQMINPSHYAIPGTQWGAICRAATARCRAWGAAAHIALDLVNKMPSAYDDPTVTVAEPALADYRPPEHHLHVTREACDVITACGAHIHSLGTHYGIGSAIYHEATTSWYPLLARLVDLSFGADTHIRRDGDLSLIVTSDTLTYGLLFHPWQRRCTLPGCPARIGEDGTAFTTYPQAVLLEHDHDPSYPLDAPQPGRWSFHS